MNHTLKQAQTLLNRDIQRSTRFEIELKTPWFTHTNNDLIQSVITPNRSVKYIENVNSVRNWNIATYYEINDLQIEYIMNYNKKNYQDYQTWLDNIIDLNTRSLNYFSEYAEPCSCIIKTFDVKWIQNGYTLMEGIYPINVPGYTVKMESGNVPFTITLYVQKMTDYTLSI